MKFATVDGRTAWVDIPVGDLVSFRRDVCDVLDVCPTFIFTNMGRIVLNLRVRSSGQPHHVVERAWANRSTVGGALGSRSLI